MGLLEIKWWLEDRVDDVKDKARTVTTNWQEEMQHLHDRWQNEYNECQKQLNEKNAQAQNYCNQYNSNVATINSERHLMRNELGFLYDFLVNIGDVGKKLTPFDYEIEEMKSVDRPREADGAEEGRTKTKKFDKFDAVGVMGMAIHPVIGLTVGVNAVRKKFKGKEEYEEYYYKYQKAKAEYAEILAKADAQIKKYSNAAEIADLYRANIATVRDSIKKTIKPEILATQAFMYADAIAERIYFNEDVMDGVAPKSIIRYENSRYNCHYLFIRNVVDYYTLITGIFTEKILTSLIEQEITEDEMEQFRSKIGEIQTETKKLEQSTVFIKE